MTHLVATGPSSAAVFPHAFKARSAKTFKVPEPLQHDLFKLLVDVKICLEQTCNRYHYISHKKVKSSAQTDSPGARVLLLTQQAPPESCKSVRPCRPHADLPQVLALGMLGLIVTVRCCTM